MNDVENMSLLGITSGVESGLAISAASLATLRPLVRVISTKLRSLRSSGSPGNSDRARQLDGESPLEKTSTKTSGKSGRKHWIGPSVLGSVLDPQRHNAGKPKLFSAFDEEAQNSD